MAENYVGDIVAGVIASATGSAEIATFTLVGSETRTKLQVP